MEDKNKISNNGSSDGDDNESNMGYEPVVQDDETINIETADKDDLVLNASQIAAGLINDENTNSTLGKPENEDNLSLSNVKVDAPINPATSFTANTNNDPAEFPLISTKNEGERKVPIFIIVLLVCSIILFCIFIVMGSMFITKNKASKLDSSSVLSILPPLQSKYPLTADIKVSINKQGSDKKEYKGTLVIDQNGKIGVRLISDINKVNDLTGYLASKTSSTKTSPTEGASEYFSYNYPEIIGYDYILNDPAAKIFGDNLGKAKLAQSSAYDKAESIFNKSANCQNYIKYLDDATGDKALSNKNLKPKFSKKDGYIFVKYDNKVIDSANKKLFEFFDTCIDSNKSSVVEFKQMIAKLDNNKPIMPLVKYRDKGANNWELVMTNRLQENVVFTVSNIKKSSNVSINSRPFSRLVNQYGLAYESCRIPPTVASDFMANKTYNFVVEDKNYLYPSEFDAGYYCSPSLAKGYAPPTSIYMPIGKYYISMYSEEPIKKFSYAYEIRSYAESYYIKNGSYPAAATLFDFSKYLPDSADEIQALVKSGDIVYKLLPEGCSANCKDFSFFYKPLPNVTIDTYSYAHVK